MLGIYFVNLLKLFTMLKKITYILLFTFIATLAVIFWDILRPEEKEPNFSPVPEVDIRVEEEEKTKNARINAAIGAIEKQPPVNQDKDYVQILGELKQFLKTPNLNIDGLISANKKITSYHAQKGKKSANLAKIQNIIVTVLDSGEDFWSEEKEKEIKDAIADALIRELNAPAVEAPTKDEPKSPTASIEKEERKNKALQVGQEHIQHLSTQIFKIRSDISYQASRSKDTFNLARKIPPLERDIYRTKDDLENIRLAERQYTNGIISLDRYNETIEKRINRIVKRAKPISL